jgi:hypothetical protein
MLIEPGSALVLAGLMIVNGGKDDYYINLPLLTFEWVGLAGQGRA